MTFELKPLPFAKDSLSPTMSAQTLEHHHGRHHAAYVKKLNELTAGTAFASQDLPSIVRATAGAEGTDRKSFNNAAQVWNHDFFWDSIAPNGGGTPPENILKRIEAAFSSLENFRDRFVEAATGQFGSGWAWLVSSKGKLAIESTPNQDSPLMEGKTPLLGCDVWEHAYYLKYQNKRPDYIAAWWNVVNWDEVAKRHQG